MLASLVCLGFHLFISLCSAQTSSTLTDVLSAHANLSSFQALLGKYPQLVASLKKYDADNQVTILAPSNHAFESIVYSDLLETWFANNETGNIASLLAYHVVPGNWNSFTLNSTFKFLPTLTSGTNFSAVTGGQRIGAVLQGGEPSELVFISGASTRSVATTKDVAFIGGTIQIIDNFLIPPTPFVDTVESYNLGNSPQSMTAFLGAIYSQRNSTLATRLNTTKDLTIFVPSNVAFEIVSGALTSMQPSTLLNLLQYHILLPSSANSSSSGPLYSSSFANNTALTTLSGATASLYLIDNSYFLNSARLLTTDILIANGVIHMLDNVLSPDASAGLPNPTSATQLPVLSTIAQESYNSSQAPFTTWLPAYVDPAAPTTTVAASSSGGGYTRTSTAVSGTATMASKKSGAKRFDRKGWMGSSTVWVFAMVMGSAMSLRM